MIPEDIRTRALDLWRAWYIDVWAAGLRPRLDIMSDQMAECYRFAIAEAEALP